MKICEFKLMHVNELLKEHFDIYPVWLWDDENEGDTPYKDGELKLLPEDQGTLFITARFKYPKGILFDGVVI